MGIAICFCVGNFLGKVFGSGQSNVLSGISMTTCCVVNVNVLYTLIQLDNSEHRSRARDQGPVARSMVSANRWLRGIKMYRFPWYLTLVSTNHASSNPG